MFTRNLIAGALSLASLFVGVIAPASAQIFTSSRSAYLAITNGNTTLDFENLGVGREGYPIGSAYYPPEAIVLSSAGRGLGLLPPNVYNTSGTTVYFHNGAAGYSDANGMTIGGILIDFLTPVYGFGTDIGLLNPNLGDYKSATVAVRGGGSTTLTFGGYLQDSNRSLDFIGYVSATPFNQLFISDPSGSLALDNVSFTSNLPLLGPGPSGNVLGTPGPIAGAGLVPLIGLAAAYLFGRKRLAA